MNYTLYTLMYKKLIIVDMTQTQTALICKSDQPRFKYAIKQTADHQEKYSNRNCGNGGGGGGGGGGVNM